MHIGLTSTGLAKIPNLSLFLPENIVDSGNVISISQVSMFNKKDFDIYIGWGNKSSGQRAIELAKKYNKKYLLLEDGFLRSIAPYGVSKEPPLSIICDDLGIYYDARDTSRLEQLIISKSLKPAISDQEKAKLSLLIKAIQNYRLSKYNNFNSQPPNTKDVILVIDQTKGDKSIQGALANANDFELMLEAAIDENPGKEIWIKTHPEVISGLKEGYLTTHNQAKNCKILAGNINPWDLFETSEKVYTVSSQLGFEALLAGCQVNCFGMPFYAGWNLTTDHKPCSRRQGSHPTIGQVFGAAYIDYSRYVDHFNNKTITIDKAINHLSNQLSIFNKNKEISCFLKVSSWKRKTVKKMFQQWQKDNLFINKEKNAIAKAKSDNGAIVVWASKAKNTFIKKCKKENINLYKLEDGFIRSVGLGANFLQPMSLSLDKTGIYYDANTPNDLENILNNYEFNQELIDRAGRIIRRLKNEEVSKYNIGDKELNVELPKDKKIIFIPGQVANDASLSNGLTSVKGNLGLIKEVRNKNPKAFIIYKPHPDVTSGQRKGSETLAEIKRLIDIYTENTHALTLINNCHEVHTMTSLTGFEAILRKKKVFCYGLPFYAGWGLTNDYVVCKRRKRKLKLHELVAATLILYPRYYDFKTEMPCEIEIVLDRIAEYSAQARNEGFLVFIRKVMGKINRSIVNSLDKLKP